MDKKLFAEDLKAALNKFTKVIDSSIDPKEFFAFLPSCLPKLLSIHKCNGYDFMEMNRLARENGMVVYDGSKMFLVDDMVSVIVKSVIE